VVGTATDRVTRTSLKYLRNAIRIITETGLRVYKELTPITKDQLDLENAVVWISDSKTPKGGAEVPLTEIAVGAFRDQMEIAGSGPHLFIFSRAMRMRRVIKSPSKRLGQPA
jgi:integrase